MNPTRNSEMLTLGKRKNLAKRFVDLQITPAGLGWQTLEVRRDISPTTQTT
jgi:hypothetical protein